MGAVYVNSPGFRNQGGPEPVNTSIARCYSRFMCRARISSGWRLVCRHFTGVTLKNQTAFRIGVGFPACLLGLRAKTGLLQDGSMATGDRCQLEEKTSGDKGSKP